MTTMFFDGVNPDLQLLSEKLYHQRAQLGNKVKTRIVFKGCTDKGG